MTTLKSLFSSFSRSASVVPKMKHVPAPPPTVPTAIKAAEECKAAGLQEGTETATFAAGCFWGVEHLFNKHFGDKEGWKCLSGYCGGDEQDPSYRKVAYGQTNHAESVQCTYQKGAVSYGELVEFFYRTHEPTQLNGQGNDRGEHYRSAIFYDSPEQEATARQITKEVQQMHVKRPIVTRIEPIKKFWTAEEYHQYYLDKNPHGYECSAHFMHW